MGLLDTLGSALGLRGYRPDYLAISSPFAEGDLQKIAWSDVFGIDYAPVSRAEAMAVPAISKARDLLTDSIGRLSMRAVRKTATGADEVLDRASTPRWLYWTPGAVSPYLRLAWTVDDLLFYGESLWECTVDSDNRPLTAWRVPYDQWSVDPANGELLDADHQPYGARALYIPSHTAGLLVRSGDTLRSAISIGHTITQRSKVAVPVMEIRVTEDEVTEQELVDLRAAYVEARADKDGAVVVTPRGVELVGHGDKADSGFMVEGRNAMRLDVANITGVPGALLDASTATASLTYSTTEGKRSEFYDYSVSPFIQTLAGRFSQDDCVPYGTRVEFDFTDQNNPAGAPLSTTRED